MRSAIFHIGWLAGDCSEASLTGRQSIRPARLAVCALATAALLSASFCRATPASVPRTGAGHAAQRAPGYLGIEFHDLTNEQAAELHLRGPRGVEVLLVDHDGPAAKAGLEPHDLITGLNGHIVASGEALRRMIREAGAGVQVSLSVFRDGRPVTVHAKLANREVVERRAWARINAAADPPAQDTIVAGFAESYTVQPEPAPVHNQNFLSSMLHSGPFTGLVVQAMPPQLANFFGAPAGMGLLVQGVDQDSPASIAGLRAGDVIMRTNGEPLHSTSEWTKRLRSDKGKPMSLTVLRDRHEVTLTLQPDPKRRSELELPELPGIATDPAICA